MASHGPLTTHDLLFSLSQHTSILKPAEGLRITWFSSAQAALPFKYVCPGWLPQKQCASLVPLLSCRVPQLQVHLQRLPRRSVRPRCVIHLKDTTRVSGGCSGFFQHSDALGLRMFFLNYYNQSSECRINICSAFYFFPPEASQILSL